MSVVDEVLEAHLEKISAIRKRDDLPELERAISDALDEYLIRNHGIISSHAMPADLMRWLYTRGCKIVWIDKQ